VQPLQGAPSYDTQRVEVIGMSQRGAWPCLGAGWRARGLRGYQACTKGGRACEVRYRQRGPLV